MENNDLLAFLVDLICGAEEAEPGWVVEQPELEDLDLGRLSLEADDTNVTAYLIVVSPNKERFMLTIKGML